MAKKTDEDLLSTCRREESDASNWQIAALTSHREKAFNYYERKPTGDEVDGQSKIVTSEFADTVESMMPGFMRVFASGENVAEFTPDNAGEEVYAKEATQYVPHVYMRENPGFQNLHDTFKDAAMSRLGGQVVDLETVKDVRSKTVTVEDALTEDGLMMLRTEAVAQEVTLTEEMTLDPSGVWVGTITSERKKKRVAVSTIAPEDILFTASARNRSEASYMGYRKPVSASDLRLMGMKQDDIDELSSDQPITEEQTQRNPDAFGNDRGRRDSERRYWVLVCWIKIDMDDDGISEMWRVVYAHAGGTLTSLIEKSEWDGPAPVVLATPILMPHQMVGRSVFDLTEDLQDIGTVLTRGLLDNLYQANRPRPIISSRVNVLSVLDWTPGSPITMLGNEDPNQHVGFVKVPSVLQEAIAGLQHFEGVKEKRTGITAYNQGMDADSLNKTVGGIDRIMGAAQQRQELMARVFAETFVKDVMREVYRAIKRASTGPIDYWSKGEWAKCDPTKWPDIMDCEVSVGLGTGNKQQEQQNLQIVGGVQAQLITLQGGQVTKDSPYIKPEHVANTARKLIEASGQRATQLFVAGPKDIENTPPQAPPPSPEMMKVQADAQAAQFKQQADMAAAQQKLAMENEHAQQKLQADIALKQQAAQADLAITREKNALEIAHSREKAAMEMQLAREKAAMELDLKRQELELEARLKKYEIDNAPTPTAADTNIKQAEA